MTFSAKLSSRRLCADNHRICEDLSHSLSGRSEVGLFWCSAGYNAPNHHTTTRMTSSSALLFYEQRGKERRQRGPGKKHQTKFVVDKSYQIVVRDLLFSRYGPNAAAVHIFENIDAEADRLETEVLEAVGGETGYQHGEGSEIRDQNGDGDKITEREGEERIARGQNAEREEEMKSDERSLRGIYLRQPYTNQPGVWSWTDMLEELDIDFNSISQILEEPPIVSTTTEEVYFDFKDLHYSLYINCV